jgi:hypothetical protein
VCACACACFLLTNQFDVGRFDPIGDSTSNPWTHIGANSCIQLTRKEKKPHCHPPRFLFSADVCLDRLRTDTPQAVTETSGVAHRPGGDELNGAPAGPERGRAAKLRPPQGADRKQENGHHLPRQARDRMYSAFPINR